MKGILEFKTKMEEPTPPTIKDKETQQEKDVKRSPFMKMKDVEGNVVISVKGFDREGAEAEEGALRTEIDEFFKNIADKCGPTLQDQLYRHAHQGGYFNSAENALKNFFLPDSLSFDEKQERGDITFTLLENGDVQFTESFKINNISGPSVKEGAQSVSGQLTCTSILSLDSEGKLQQTQGKVRLTSQSEELTKLFKSLNEEVEKAAKPGLLTRLWNGIKSLGSAIVGVFKSKPAEAAPPAQAAGPHRTKEAGVEKSEQEAPVDLLRGEPPVVFTRKSGSPIGPQQLKKEMLTRVKNERKRSLNPNGNGSEAPEAPDNSQIKGNRP